MQELRVGIIGMGIGRANAIALDSSPRCRVTALCDILPERMPEIAAQIPSQPDLFFTDHRELCASDEVDAIFVGTPNQFHVPVAMDVLNAGKHVMVTKPLADALQPAEDLVALAESTGLVNMMSLSTRYSPAVQFLGHQVQQGAMGEIYYARARSVRRDGIPAWSPGFVREGGGAFRDMGVHYLDSAWWVMGLPEPESVMGVAGAKFGPRGQGYFSPEGRVRPPEEYWRQFKADDYGGGIVRFRNGAGLIIESFWASHQQPEQQIELFGTEGGATLHPLTLFRTHDGEQQNIAVEQPEDKRQAWLNVAQHFIDCILDGVECQAPLRHGLVVQRMMEGLLESAQTGKPVYLPTM